MNFLAFQNELRPLLVFNTRDIKKVDPAFNPVNLSIWQKHRYFIKLAKGLYTFSDPPIRKELLYYAANKIIDPSYVSCESALSYYGIMYKEDQIVSVNPIRSHTYISDYGGFKFHKANSSMLKDYVIEKHNQHCFKIASPEKAIVDFFFFNPKYQTRAQIKTLNFKASDKRDLISKDNIFNIANSHANNLLERRINNFVNLYL